MSLCNLFHNEAPVTRTAFSPRLYWCKDPCAIAEQCDKSKYPTNHEIYNKASHRRWYNKTIYLCILSVIYDKRLIGYHNFALASRHTRLQPQLIRHPSRCGDVLLIHGPCGNCKLHVLWNRFEQFSIATARLHNHTILNMSTLASVFDNDYD